MVRSVISTVLILILNLGFSQVSGKLFPGVVKIDLDTTILFTNLGALYEVSGETSDTLRKLCDREDTLLCQDILEGKLYYKERVYPFKMGKGLKQLLGTPWIDVYFKNKKVEKLNVKKLYKRTQYLIYEYYDKNGTKILRLPIWIKGRSLPGNF